MEPTNIHVFRPTASYLVEIQIGVSEQSVGRVSSYWRDGEPMLLQLSSYLRGSGEQIGARERLADRMKSTPETWEVFDDKIFAVRDVDQASAETRDAKRVLWLHSYFVWPNLTLYSTISGFSSREQMLESWPVRTLESIKLNIH